MTAYLIDAKICLKVTPFVVINRCFLCVAYVANLMPAHIILYIKTNHWNQRNKKIILARFYNKLVTPQQHISATQSKNTVSAF